MVHDGPYPLPSVAHSGAHACPCLTRIDLRAEEAACMGQEDEEGGGEEQEEEEGGGGGGGVGDWSNLVPERVKTTYAGTRDYNTSTYRYHFLNYEYISPLLNGITPLQVNRVGHRVHELWPGPIPHSQSLPT